MRTSNKKSCSLGADAEGCVGSVARLIGRDLAFFDQAVKTKLHVNLEFSADEVEKLRVLFYGCRGMSAVISTMFDKAFQKRRMKHRVEKVLTTSNRCVVVVRFR